MRQVTHGMKIAHLSHTYLTRSHICNNVNAEECVKVHKVFLCKQSGHVPHVVLRYSSIMVIAA